MAPHIHSKDYGKDVLLFASPSKINKEAMCVIHDSKRGTLSRSKAFWEILAKRSNESVHLLSVSVMANICRSLSMAPDTNLAIGTSKVISDYLSKKRSMIHTSSDSIQDFHTLFLFFNKFLLSVDQKLFQNLLVSVEDNIHRIKTLEEIEGLIEEITIMGNHCADVQSVLIRTVVLDRLAHMKTKFSKIE